ncbi:hypothetical protein BH10PAT3_BH10PAT3_6340 [soil metagenome]
MKTKLSRTVSSKRYKKRLVRYGLLMGNLAILAIATLFVLHNPNSQAVSHNVASVSDSQATNPLDTLSAADIAVNAARMTNLAEATSVTNQADSVAAELNTHVVEYAVVPKPQILSSAIKTKKDLKNYTVVAGDTLANLATRFGVTSDSIKWSNGLTGNALTLGNSLAIPPIDGIAVTVKAGDTPDSLATKYNASKDQIITFNDAEVTGLKVGEWIIVPGGSITPPPARTSYFANYSFGTTAIYGGNGYDYGWCTWYVSNRRAELGRPVPNNLGNAYSWYTVAQRSGLPVGSTPQAGAVAVNQGGNHVSVVEQVNDDGSFWISEMNASGQVSMTDTRSAGGWGRIDWRLVSSAGSLKFIY